MAELLPGCPAGKREALIKQAGSFFAEAILPLEKSHFSSQEAASYLRKIIETLSQRTVELAASNLELSAEVGQRKAAEAALKKSERHYSELLAQSDHLQEQLRQLSRQILSAQEEERRSQKRAFMPTWEAEAISEEEKKMRQNVSAHLNRHVNIPKGFSRVKVNLMFHGTKKSSFPLSWRLTLQLYLLPNADILAKAFITQALPHMPTSMRQWTLQRKEPF